MPPIGAMLYCKRGRRWSLICVAKYFAGRVFTHIQLEYRLAWPCFQEYPKLVPVSRFAAMESESPVLTWEKGKGYNVPDRFIVASEPEYRLNNYCKKQQ